MGGAHTNQNSLCLQRLYNHEQDFATNKETIKMNEWELFVGPPSKACWICSKAHYTLFFHEVDSAIAFEDNLTLQLLPQHVQSKNHCVLAMTEELDLKMEPISQFSERVDDYFAQNFNFLKYFKDKGQIQPSVLRVKDLDCEQL